MVGLEDWEKDVETWYDESIAAPHSEHIHQTNYDDKWNALDDIERQTDQAANTRRDMQALQDEYEELQRSITKAYDKEKADDDNEQLQEVFEQADKITDEYEQVANHQIPGRLALKRRTATALSQGMPSEEERTEPSDSDWEPPDDAKRQRSPCSKCQKRSP